MFVPSGPGRGMAFPGQWWLSFCSLKLDELRGRKPMEALTGPSAMGLSQQGRLVGRRAGPPGVNMQEPRQVQTKLKNVQPLGAWQGLSKPGAAKGRPRSPCQQAGHGGFLRLGYQWESSEGHMDLGSLWLDTGWAGPVPCRQRAVKVKGAHEPGFQQPPPADPTLPRRLGTPWTAPTLINPGSSSQTLLLADPGRGSPAWGEGRALDCSHSGGWVGEWSW